MQYPIREYSYGVLMNGKTVHAKIWEKNDQYKEIWWNFKNEMAF